MVGVRMILRDRDLVGLLMSLGIGIGIESQVVHVDELELGFGSLIVRVRIVFVSHLIPFRYLPGEILDQECRLRIAYLPAE